MKQNILKLKTLGFILLFSTTLFGQTINVKPVTPNASPEAIALLNYFYSISGKYILTGQHNYPATQNRNTQFVKEYMGKTPVIYSVDFGFSKEGDKDCYLARPAIVKEAIKQYKVGSIIAICWHAVPPTADEPITFQPLPGANPDALASVQGKLTEKQYKEMLTPGTKLYKHWCMQVDSIAKYLKMFQAARVPVLWRPYHEMNGSWFWWGGRLDKYGTVAIYKQIFDRLTRVHKINNLVWVWSVDRPNNETMQFKNYYPGNKFLDILALDVYGNDFKQDYYDKMLALSEGKPITLGEVGNPPSAEIMEKQPNWVYYVVWAGMVRNTAQKQYHSLAENNHVLYQEDKSYIESTASFRKSCMLPPLEVNAPQPADFSGTWILNEDKSSLDNSRAADLPSKISVIEQGNALEINKTFIVEYDTDRMETQKLILDGPDCITKSENATKITSSKHIAGSGALEINSKIAFIKNGKTIEMVSTEKWDLTGRGKNLVIEQSSNSYGGKKNIKMVFDKAIKE